MIDISTMSPVAGASSSSASGTASPTGTTGFMALFDSLLTGIQDKGVLQNQEGTPAANVSTGGIPAGAGLVAGIGGPETEGNDSLANLGLDPDVAAKLASFLQWLGFSVQGQDLAGLGDLDLEQLDQALEFLERGLTTGMPVSDLLENASLLMPGEWDLLDGGAEEGPRSLAQAPAFSSPEVFDVGSLQAIVDQARTLLEGALRGDLVWSAPVSPESGKILDGAPATTTDVVATPEGLPSELLPTGNSTLAVGVAPLKNEPLAQAQGIASETSPMGSAPVATGTSLSEGNDRGVAREAFSSAPSVAESVRSGSGKTPEIVPTALRAHASPHASPLSSRPAEGRVAAANETGSRERAADLRAPAAGVSASAATGVPAAATSSSAAPGAAPLPGTSSANLPTSENFAATSLPAAASPVGESTTPFPVAGKEHVRPGSVASEFIGRQVLERMDVHLRQGKRELTVRLWPEELGEVRLSLRIGEADRIDARILVQNDAVRQSLLDATPQLREALARHGMEMGKLSVGVDSGSADARKDASGDRSGNHGNGSPSHRGNPWMEETVDYARELVVGVDSGRRDGRNTFELWS